MLDIKMFSKILQLNCQKSYAVMCDIGQMMCERGIVIALLQEPYATSGCIRGLPAGMRVFPDSRANSAVVVNDVGIECTLVNSTNWGVCVCLSGSFGRVFVGSVYCAFGVPLEPYMSYMDEVLLLASSVPVILGLDANAASPLWFSKISRHASGYLNLTRGDLLAEWAVSKDVRVVNEPSEWYTFDGPMGKSDIDVTFVNEAALGVFAFEWSVLGGHGVSDHNPIEVCITHTSTVLDSERGNRWRTCGANWSLHEVLVREESTQVDLDTFRALSVDEQVACVSRWLTCVNDRMFERTRKVNLRHVKWWTHELTLKRRSVRTLRKRFQRARIASTDDAAQLRIDYRRCMNEYKQMLVKVKEDEWRSFLERNKHDPWGSAYKIVRGRGKTCDVSSLQVDGVQLTAWSDCMNVLLNGFFPRANQRELPPSVAASADPLREGELGVAFSMLKSRKSPGADGFTGEMCKSVWKSIPDYLKELYGRCVNEGYFPHEWKNAKVIVLLKSPDRIRSNPRSFRGISLLPVLGKVLERVMIERLQEIVDEQMSDRQYGFRQGKCTEDAWKYVKDCVATSTSNYVLGIFIDFQGAFDNLSWDSVLRKLRDCGCRELSLWESYFSGRRACAVGRHESVTVDVVRGCPQGSICGPYIWNLMMDTLLRQLEQVCKCCAYADDLIIMVEGQSRAEIEALAGAHLRTVCDWGNSVGVSLAMDKTTTMLLKGRLSASRHPSIGLNGVFLRYVTEVKYLGITFGERMCFTPHFTGLKRRLLGVVGQVRRILRNEWGLSRRAVRTIYNGLFVACATYGSSVWCDAVTTVVGRKKVLACQRVTMMIKVQRNALWSTCS